MIVRRQIAPIRDEERGALLELWVASWRATFPTIDFDARRVVDEYVLLFAAGSAETLTRYVAVAVSTRVNELQKSF